MLTTLGEDVYNPRTGNSYDPPRPFLPADDRAVGKKWSARVTITIPTGTFKTYKIEQAGNNGWNTKVKSTYWILPNSGFSLKAIVDIHRGSGKRESWVQEATSVKLAAK